MIYNIAIPMLWGLWLAGLFYCVAGPVGLIGAYIIFGCGYLILKIAFPKSFGDEWDWWEYALTLPLFVFGDWDEADEEEV